MGTWKKYPPGTTRPWEGGQVRWDKTGRATYWIVRRYAGKRWCFSLKVHEEEAAIKRLRQFEADPFGFRVDGAASDRPLLFDSTIRDAFERWSRDERHNSDGWVAKQREILAWWGERLGACDLKRLRLVEDVLPVLDKYPEQRQHRIAVLKTFYSWLRKARHSIKPFEDPTLGALSAPQARPEQWKRQKAFTREQREAVLAKLDGKWLAAAIVQAGTGWHCTEVVRFAESGSIVQAVNGEQVLVCPRAKSGAPHRTRVSAAVAAAARDLRVAEGFGYWPYWRALQEACGAAGIEPGTVSPGNFRHSVATMAIDESGADPKAVAAFLDHASDQTTRRFYATHAAAAKVPTPR